MKKGLYTVTIGYISRVDFDIEANNKNDAENKAFELLYFEYPDIIDGTIESVVCIKEPKVEEDVFEEDVKNQLKLF